MGTVDCGRCVDCQPLCLEIALETEAKTGQLKQILTIRYQTAFSLSFGGACSDSVHGNQNVYLQTPLGPGSKVYRLWQGCYTV
jgi:hypothetical protein